MDWYEVFSLSNNSLIVSIPCKEDMTDKQAEYVCSECMNE